MFIANFGLPEHESETKSLSKVLDENLFSLLDAKANISSSCLTGTKRVGEPSPSKTRMVLVNFEHYADKLKLFGYRDTLRNNNIRIANDLAYWQRQQIKELNARGFIGYFKNGKLCRVPKSSKSAGGERREFRRGVRTSDDRSRERIGQLNHDAEGSKSTGGERREFRRGVCTLDDRNRERLAQLNHEAEGWNMDEGAVARTEADVRVINPVD
ncbi:hypothetical protein DPMN_025955 [Dreissena polymorpha]|uniref:Uncharacterized protein n=1 Tax=Dreissena polymorpha TaxID=45954 RepID=A0A9D4RCA9_DREPO|nr:hypothetical protein DPMN_025955 [Dreissena polymorpha]